MAEKMLFYYFGDDEAYFKALQAEFKKSTKLSLDFKRVYESDEKKIQSLILLIYKYRPACVFIDFSKQTQDYIHLARVLSRTPPEHKMAVIGLVDYLSPASVLMDSMTAGATLTHIKSAETFDVIFGVTKMIAPAEIGEHGFATAGLKEDTEVGIPVKIGYVHTEGIHFETDFKLEKGNRFKLTHPWLQKRVVPSKDMFVTNVSTSNIFYHFLNSIDAEFVFVDEFLPPEGMDESVINEKKIERDDLILYHKKQLSKWIEENTSGSLEKKAKVLVVDREFLFYQNQARTDKHPYTIRCVPQLGDIGVELDRMQPQVIAFALDKEGVNPPRNTEDEIKKLTAALNAKFPDPEEAPFLIIFGSKTASKIMQETFKYGHLMSTDNELSVDLLTKMADIFEKRLNKSKVIPKKKSEHKVFLKKNNPASVGEIHIPITILKLSETDMIFTSEASLPPGMNLHLVHPVDMFITTQPAKSEGKTPQYYGIVHAIGESQKKELRRFVNTVFFRDHDAQLQAESDEFKKLNDQKLNEKVAAEEAQKAAEAAALAQALAEKNKPAETPTVTEESKQPDEPKG